jgi:hypothetical protein
MPYTSVSDVQGLAPSVPINNQSKPSDGDVRVWIADVERMLNASLAGIGYVVPVTDPDSIAILKLKVAHAVMAMIMRARPNPEADPESFQRQYDMYVKALGDSRDRTELPPGAARVDTPIKNESGLRVSASFSDLAAYPDDRIKVTRDMKF